MHTSKHHEERKRPNPLPKFKIGDHVYAEAGMRHNYTTVRSAFQSTKVPEGESPKWLYALDGCEGNFSEDQLSTA